MRLPSLPLTPAAPGLHLPQPRLTAPTSPSLASPDPEHCPGPIPGHTRRDPNPAPSFFQGTPSRRAPSASAPCSCYPPPCGSGSLVHSTRGYHPIRGGPVWVQGLRRGTDCGEGGRSLTGGLEQLTGCRDWSLAVSTYSARVCLSYCDAEWWWQRKAGGSRCC